VIHGFVINEELSIRAPENL